MSRSPLRLLLILLFVPLLAAVAFVRPGSDRAAGGSPITTSSTTSTAPVARERPAGEPDPTTSTTAVPVTGLHPGLEDAFARAVAAARAAGHRLSITSGFRTAAEQARMLEEAIGEHGSEEAALRWVFTPERSMHVRGLAVDVGDGPAADWLDRHGDAFGLCRTLAWEWWHFEWRAAWEAARTCPDPVDDPADAPGP